MDKLTICTDACKGLESAVKIVFPQAEKRVLQALNGEHEEIL
jgi:hypothetical protein